MSLGKVKRNLFGSVKKTTSEYLKNEQLKFIADKSREWNFDFIEFVPLNDGSFLWSKIENNTKVMKVVNVDQSNVGTSRKRQMKTTSKQHQKSIKDYMKVSKRIEEIISKVESKRRIAKDKKVGGKMKTIPNYFYV